MRKTKRCAATRIDTADGGRLTARTCDRPRGHEDHTHMDRHGNWMETEDANR